MSLISNLNDPDSPVRRFMTARFPLTRSFSFCCNRETVVTSWIPPPKPPRRKHYAYGTVGTALDYRIRYYFRVTPYKKLVATQGAALMLAEGSINERVVTNFFEGLSDFVDRVQPARRRLDLRQEKQLARYCLVLALFEQVYRAGVLRILFSNSPLAFASVVVSFRRNFLLDLVSPEWVDDVVAQSYAFYESQSDLCCRRAVLNPTFEGSRDVGGADADLIVNRCLIDIKSTLRPAVSRHLLYQLLGYV